VALAEQLRDPTTGQIRRIKLSPTTDARSRAPRFAAFIASRPELAHIRTRRNSPGQNGVRERAFGSLKYEHRYHMQIETLQDLTREADAYRQVFNHVRPHEALAFYRPIEVHHDPSLKPATKITHTEPSRQES
jgi:putative transposase